MIEKNGKMLYNRIRSRICGFNRGGKAITVNKLQDDIGRIITDFYHSVSDLNKSLYDPVLKDAGFKRGAGFYLYEGRKKSDFSVVIDGADEGLHKLALSVGVALKESGLRPDVIVPVPGEHELFCAPRPRFKRNNALLIRLVRGSTGLFCSGGTVICGAAETSFTFSSDAEAGLYATALSRLTDDFCGRNFVCRSLLAGKQITLTAMWFDDYDLEKFTMEAARLTADSTAFTETTLAYSPLEQDAGLLGKVFSEIRPDGPLEPCFEVRKYLALTEGARRLGATVKASDEAKAAEKIAQLLTALFTEES